VGLALGALHLPPTPARASAPTSPKAPERAVPRNLLVISIDGLPYDTFAAHRDALPHLDGLAKRGVFGASRTIFPSMTWAAHASLVTGVRPLRHGVLGNRMYDRARRRVAHAALFDYAKLYRAPTLFDALHAARRSVATVLWPATVGAPSIDWNVPEVYGQKNFEAMTTPGLLDELETAGLPARSLGSFSKRQLFLQDAMARSVALHLLARHRPDALFVHFLSVDSLSHAYGPRTPQVLWGLQLVDGFVGDLLSGYRRAGLLASTTVVVVSDHGFRTVTRRLDPDRLLLEAGLISQRDKLDREPVRTVANGHALFVYLTPEAQRAGLGARVAGLFRGRPEVAKVYAPKRFGRLGLPRPSADPHAPDLVALARPDVAWGPVRMGRSPVMKTKPRGLHGDLPGPGEMRPVFLAAGVGVLPHARAVRMDNLDVAPSLAAVLGLAWPGPTDGEARADLFSAAPRDTAANTGAGRREAPGRSP